MNEVVLIKVGLLQENPVNRGLYNTNDSSFVGLMELVRKFGVLEPILIDRDHTIISGHRRFRAVVQLGMDTIPAIVTTNPRVDAMIGDGGKVRRNYTSAIREYVSLHEKSGVSQGMRSDLLGIKPLKDVVAERFDISVGTMKSLIRLNNKLISRYGCFETSKDWWDAIDEWLISPLSAIEALLSFGTQVPNSVTQVKSTSKRNSKKTTSVRPSKGGKVKSAQPKSAVIRQLPTPSFTLPVVPEDVTRAILDGYVRRGKVVYQDQQDVITDRFKIYQSSSANMYQLEDNTVQCIVCSPPYFRMRVYGNGANELGRERQMVDYINNMMTIFDECKRVLKPDGSLWVNINDCFDNGAYNLTEAHLKVAMEQRGWFLHDELIWSKNNPTPTRSDRSQRNHEYFLLFKKQKDIYYDRSWLANCETEIGNLVYGLKGKGQNRKVKSSFTISDTMFTTNTANTKNLRSRCSEMGVEDMNHSATFPSIIPYLAIKLTSREGDLVLDCFNGTGTTGMVATSLGRNYVGYELNPTYIRGSIVQMTSFEVRTSQAA